MGIFCIINIDRKGNTDIGFIWMNYYTLEIPKQILNKHICVIKVV